MTDDLTFSDCRCGAGDERIMIERCTATWRILGDVYVVYCTECGEAESFVSMDRNDASALNGYALHAWNNRHGAGDAEDGARLDWLIEQHATLFTDGEGYWQVAWEFTNPATFGPMGKSPRAAIDAARAGERG